MALVGIDGAPLMQLGAAGRNGTPLLASVSGTALDATAEAWIAIGYILTEDGTSHTIDTTGSSSLGWMSGALTFANAATVVKVGLSTLDTGTGPPGRATNVANVITFDVSKTLTVAGGGLTANAWQEHVPDAGTKTIANGDLIVFAVQAVTIGGVDIIRPATITAVNTASPSLSYITEYIGASYTSANGYTPNAVITFSDGKLGFFFGGNVFSVATTTTTWNNTSGTKEYGNFFQMPYPAKIYGFYHGCGIGGDTDFVLYSDPLGTPVGEKTVSVDLNVVGTATANRMGYILFPTPYTTVANQPIAAIVKPTSATNDALQYKTFNIAAHQKSEAFGTNGYAINRNTGAFAAQNSNKDRYAIGLLVGAYENPARPIYGLGI